MKIALCLFGYPKGSTVYALDAYQEKFKYLFDNVMVYKPDVFIHSWDMSLKEEIIDIFKPKKHTFENQKQFQEEKNSLDLNRFNDSRGNILKTLSFFYTRKASNNLKKIHEDENKFKYDCVLSSRFDIGYHNRGKNKTSYIDFNPRYDMDFVYSAYWNQINAGLSDHWYYSNSSNIDYVCNIYDHTLKYLKKNSEYCNTMMLGWPDSNQENEFSNECLKENKTENLKRYPEHYCLNNHCLYKWHFLTSGLWSKCKFLNEDLWI